MANDSFSQFFLVRALHSLVVFVLLGAFGYDLYVNITNYNLKTQEFNVTTENELVPPALTFCITKNINYTFTIKIYDQTISDSDRGTFLKVFPADSNELSSLKGQVARCWVLSPPIGKDRALLKNPPPVANVEDMEFTTTRFFNGDDVTTPLLINIFDPLKEDSLFQYNKFLILNPDVNRVIQFTRTKHIDINGLVTNDIKFNIIDTFRSPDQTVAGISSTNKFTFRAASFDVETSTEKRVTTLSAAMLSVLTFLGILIGRIYFPLVGQGKYKPWGYINQLVGYYPIENIVRGPKDEEEGFARSGGPGVEEKLEIYLSRIGNAGYMN